jgi:hypothetical protein
MSITEIAKKISPFEDVAEVLALLATLEKKDCIKDGDEKIHGFIREMLEKGGLPKYGKYLYKNVNSKNFDEFFLLRELRMLAALFAFAKSKISIEEYEAYIQDTQQAFREALGGKETLREMEAEFHKKSITVTYGG